MTTQACGATRPRVIDPNWECTGRDLIVVSHIAGVPIVLPARALDVIEPESWWDSPLDRFAAGDHCHLVVPARPPAMKFEGDTTLLFGDSAERFREIGFAAGGSVIFVSNGAS